MRVHAAASSYAAYLDGDGGLFQLKHFAEQVAIACVFPFRIEQLASLLFQL